MRETDLYPPVKAFLEAQGYEVKGEIGACDVVGKRGDEAPVIVELKTSFTLALVFQAIRRQSVTDAVYLAVPPFSGRGVRGQVRDAVALCRRLGLGLLTVRLEPSVFVDPVLDPAPYRPRQSKARRTRLLREFSRRVGDPSAGGATTKRPRMTAYRQDALRIARLLDKDGPTKASAIAEATGIPKARAILYRDVYGWFEREGQGIYALTPKGVVALTEFADALDMLAARTEKY